MVARSAFQQKGGVRFHLYAQRNSRLTAVSNNNPIPNNKPFKKGQSGNPKGRPKNVETLLKEHFLDEHNVKLSKGQVQDIIKNVLGKSRSELVELAKNDQLPFWIALIAKKAQRDYEKGSIHILDVLFDRVYGKPKEEVEQTVNGGKPDKVEIIIRRPNVPDTDDRA